MIRKLTLAATTLSLALGMVVGPTTAAHAAAVTVTAGPGSSVTCNITAKAKLSVKLKNNWTQADHAGDPDAVVAAIPDTNFSGPPVAVTTTAKAKGTCTGTVTDGTHTLPVTSVKFSATTTSTGTDEPTCLSLLSLANGSTFFDATVDFKATGGKVTSTTLHSLVGVLVDSHGFGFVLNADGTGGTSTTGSFASGSSVVNAYVEQTTIDQLLGAPVSSGAPVSTSGCEASLKIKKAGTPAETATLKAPKGFSKLGIGPAATDSAPSNVVFTG